MQTFARVWWGRVLVEQTFVVDVAQFERTWSGPFSVQYVTTLAPERVRAPRGTLLREFATPIALILCLIAALFVAIVPMHPSYRPDGFVGTEGGGEGDELEPRRSPFVHPSAKKAAAAPIVDQAPILTQRPKADPSTKPDPRVKARAVVDQIFGKASLATLDLDLGPIGNLSRLEPQTSALIGTTTFSSGTGGGLEPGGIGTLSTRGNGGAESSYGTGIGRIGRLRGRKPQLIIDVFTGTPIVIGTLDRDLIRRAIHANRGQIRYCYERALDKTPDLNGSITTKFMIAPNGLVANVVITDSTVSDPDFEACVARRVRTWEFPVVQSGGSVLVNYPWHFALTEPAEARK